jgi:hypothetical protein
MLIRVSMKWPKRASYGFNNSRQFPIGWCEAVLVNDAAPLDRPPVMASPMGCQALALVSGAKDTSFMGFPVVYSRAINWLCGLVTTAYANPTGLGSGR